MVYNYTKPRGPIEAMIKSPGPVYSLPPLCGYDKHDPRSVYKKNPSWSLKGRDGKLFHGCSPGPVHFPNIRFNRFGKSGEPAYTFRNKPRDLKMFESPGPGAYTLQDPSLTTWSQSPRYTISHRNEYKDRDVYPAPNMYTLPPVLGRTVEGGKRQPPVASLKGRNKHGRYDADLSKTPGPAKYPATVPNRFQRQAPQWSLGGRVEMPGDKTTKPGPGTHFPEKVKLTRQSAPSYTFGVKWSDYVTPLIVNVED